MRQRVHAEAVVDGDGEQRGLGAARDGGPVAPHRQELQPRHEHAVSVLDVQDALPHEPLVLLYVTITY